MALLCGSARGYERTECDFPKHRFGENGAVGVLRKHRFGVLRIAFGALISYSFITDKKVSKQFLKNVDYDLDFECLDSL
jgi:hypothetical protein